MSAFLFQGNRYEAMWIPTVVAVCPECGGKLWFQITAWDADTGRPLEDGEGIELDCEREPEIDSEDREGEHRWWQGEWMPVKDKVAAWARRFIRVVAESRPA